MNERPWVQPFLERLRGLAPPDNPAAWDRATLAELRRGLGKEPHVALVRAGRVFAGVPASERVQDDAALIATLFRPVPGRRRPRRTRPQLPAAPRRDGQREHRTAVRRAARLRPR